MSSTTDRSKGQALPIFVVALTAVLLAAALAFDTGDVLLEKRDQQNAADAAALHGARYLTSSDTQARTEARQLATDNGFTQGSGDQIVNIYTPARNSARWGNMQGTIEVQICNTRPSIFASVAGILDWDVCARAIAASFEDSAGPWSMVALKKTDDNSDCKAVQLGGNGTIDLSGSLQVNSDCLYEDSGALFRSGNGEILMDSGGWICNVHGEIKNDGKTELLQCPTKEHSDWLRDPLAGIGEPLKPELAPEPQPLNAAAEAAGIPTRCQGSSNPATEEDPGVCKFNGNEYADTEWLLSAGLYPGGLELHDGTFKLLPGIYWIGGGGLKMVGGGATVESVDSTPVVGTDGYPDYSRGGGVLFFNTQLSDTSGGRIDVIDLGGADANIYLEPLDDPDSEFDRLVIYQDRDYDINGDDVTINGSNSYMEVAGTVYVPSGDVKINGSGGQLVMDLVIGSTFQVSGAPSSLIEVRRRQEYSLLFSAAGLVE